MESTDDQSVLLSRRQFCYVEFAGGVSAIDDWPGWKNHLLIDAQYRRPCRCWTSGESICEQEKFHGNAESAEQARSAGLDNASSLHQRSPA
jgi:hypothetical protein